ncbi:MAG TPA: ATP-binding protein [Terracidiphilus sp.]|jgi:SpoVK/Ycf46/Vps4 family AAA+-type ATPase
MNAVEIRNFAPDRETPREPDALSWTEANQTCLVMEFARLQARLENPSNPGEDDREIEETLQRIRESLDQPAAIDQLAASFDLSGFERQILLLAAGIEMDSKLAALCFDAVGGRGFITFSLVLSALEAPHWSALAPRSPLRRFHLIELDPGAGLTNAPLRIDERILHYLAGINRMDARLAPLLRYHEDPLWLADEHAAVVPGLLPSLQKDLSLDPVLHLYGDDRNGQQDVAARLARHMGRHLFVLSAENLASAALGATAGARTANPSESIPAFLDLWAREATLLPAMLLVACGSEPIAAPIRQAIELLPAPLVVASRDPFRIERRTVRQAINKPIPASQKRLWSSALDQAGAAVDGKIDDLADHLAGHFRFSTETIASIGTLAGASTSNRNGETGNGNASLRDQLWMQCRALARPRLENLAQHIEPKATWDDLVLPEPQKELLLRLSAQARHRLTVYEDWGFGDRGRRGLGITALFAGPSGTGKTLAAEVLAGVLGLDLFRIDLSAIVSKYIGESEKNLKQVFDAAEEGGVVLLFDEADALFGKRSEVRDSHDRYANIEVSYLLQRMETFEGLAVLTTNLKSSLDKAFQRRLRFTVDFPFPGPQEREQIWRRMFPSQAPTRNLNLEQLAQLNMTGGNIRNIALNAAFLAAESDSPIGMQHILHATRQEAIKIERPLAESETRGWA